MKIEHKLNIALTLLCIVLISINFYQANFIEPIEIEVEVIKEVIILPEPEYMERVGYDFTDIREPTNEELFVMEESLSLCYNPTYDEVVSFIEEDITNYNEWIEDWYICADFCWDVMFGARCEKMRCGYVVIYPEADEEYEYDDYFDAPDPHAIVVFDTSDKGLIFVDASLDDIFTYSEFLKMEHNNKYYAEDEWYEIEMDFDHYTIDWFYWYYEIELMQAWQLYKSEYPDFEVNYDKYL